QRARYPALSRQRCGTEGGGPLPGALLGECSRWSLLATQVAAAQGLPELPMSLSLLCALSSMAGPPNALSTKVGGAAPARASWPCGNWTTYPWLSPPTHRCFPRMAWAREVFYRRHAVLRRLGKELHELEHILWHLVRDREPKLLGLLEGDRIIVRPGAFGEH